MSQNLTPLRAATHGAGRANLTRALAHHLPFKTSGALYGVTSPIFITAGHLNVHEQGLLDEDRDNIAFIVYSYATPIYWRLSDGSEHIVDQKFSPTTSKHQGFLWMVGRTDLF